MNVQHAKRIPLPSFRLSISSKNFILPIWIVLLLGAITLGVFGAYQIVTRTESTEITWGILVPSYVFFALAATGSSLVNSISTVFNVKQFKPYIKKGVWLSLVLVIPALIFIVLDLGRWNHAYNLYLLFNPTSRLGWMGILYVAFILLLLVELIVVIKEDHLPKWSTITIGSMVLFITLAVHTNLGALFGAINSKPLLFSYFLPLHFIVSAVLVGAAIQIAFLTLCSFIKQRKIPEELRLLFIKGYRPLIIGLILINWLLIIIKFVPGMLSSHTSPYIELLISGEYSWFFWGFEILLGGIIPILLLINRHTKDSIVAIYLSSIFVVLGVYFSKYDLLIAGQSIMPFTNEFIPYTPPAIDILLLTGGISLCLLCCTAGYMLLPLGNEERPKWLIFKLGKK